MNEIINFELIFKKFMKKFPYNNFIEIKNYYVLFEHNLFPYLFHDIPPLFII